MKHRSSKKTKKSTIENIAKGKKWTDEERIKLYKLATVRGKKWSEYAEEFGTSAKSCSDKYRKTNWNSVFSRNNLTEAKVLKEAWNEYNPSVDLSEDLSAESIVEKAKSKIIQSSEKRIQKELTEKAAITSLILEKIESGITKVPAIEPAKIKYPKVITRRTPEEACLILSDLHVGLTCIPEEVGGLGHYNKDIFLERMNNLINSIIKITEIHRQAYKVDTLNIFGIGDFVHGSNDAGQWGFLHTEQNIVDQIFCVVSEISKALLKLHKVFSKIKFYGIYGNHGRVGKRGMEKPYVNWDFLCYKMIETALSQQKNVEFVLPKTPFQVAEISGHKFLLIHGDQVRCFHPDSKISIFDGTVKNIQDIDIGDRVISHNGKINKVTHKHEYEANGKILVINSYILPKNTWKITPNHEVPVVFASQTYCPHLPYRGRNKCKCSVDYCGNNLEEPEIKWVKAEVISQNDYIVIPRPKFNCNFKKYITKDIVNYYEEKKHNREKDIPSNICVDKNLGLILGQYLADGNCAGQSKKNNHDHHTSVEIVYNEEEKEFWKETILAWEKVFLDTPKLIKRKDMNVRAQRIQGYGRRAASFIGNLCGHGSCEKKIHPSIMEWNVESLKSLIVGYLRGDGHTKRHQHHKKYNRTHSVSATTYSMDLGWQLFWISRKCGYSPSIKFYTRSGKKECILSYYGDDARELGPKTQRFYSNSEDENIRSQSKGYSINFKDYTLVRVKDVYYEEYKGKIYDLTVENSETYTVNGAAVHNSWNGIPFYGLLRAEGKFRNMLSRDKSFDEFWEKVETGGIDPEDTKELIKQSLDYSRAFDYMIMGHYHQSAELESNGGGKIIMNNCFVPGTKIYKKHGLVENIEDVKVGDMVLTPRKRYRKVENVFQTDYDGNISNIKIRGMTETIKCTPNHEFLGIPASNLATMGVRKSIANSGKLSKTHSLGNLKNKKVNVREKWIPAEFLGAGDYVKIVTNPKTESFSTSTNFNKSSITINEDLMRLFGFYLAEGSMSGNRSAKTNEILNQHLVFSFHFEERKYANFVKKCIKKHFGKIAREEEFPERTVRTIIVDDSKICSYFHNLFGKGSDSKFIHKKIMSLPNNLIESMLVGYFQGDGHCNSINKNRTKDYSKTIINSTTSERLHYQLLSLIRKLGYNPVWLTRPATKKRKKSYLIQFGGKDSVCFSEKIGMKFKDNVVDDHLYIIKIGDDVYYRVDYVFTSHYKGKIYDLQVKDDASYNVWGVSCHNSFIGGDDYTVNQLLLAGSASQKFFGIHPEGRSWTYDIDLDRK